MRIGDEVLIKGTINEIRKDIVIIENEGGYFGTVPSEIVEKKTEWIDVNDELPPEKPGEYLITWTYGNGELPNGGWIPVSESLPEVDERVLVTRRMFHWANEPVEYAVGIESFSGNIDFVAWMPLPEAYKAEREDKE